MGANRAVDPQPTPGAVPVPGRKPLDARRVRTGIVFVLKTGIDWDDRPAERGWGCGKTCKAYLKAWHRAGVWDRRHRVLLRELPDGGHIDWSRAAIDSTSVRARGGGDDTGPSPTDRGRPGTTHHVATDAPGIPWP